MENNFYITGVGGQGVVRLGQILALYGLEKGKKVRFYKQVGMAQRGGPVHCEVRIGEVFGSRIPPLSADIIVVMELAEGLKALEFVKPGGMVILNKKKIYPLDLMAYPERYPQEREIIQLFEEAGARIFWIEAGKIAQEINLPLAENIIILGVIANFLSLDKSILLSVLEKNVPGSFLAKNLEAFEKGFQYSEEMK
ncbi:MAG: indolepyruvate oxidoreductase subunit beta [Candidatus Caldatribacteriota bacterium]